MMQLLINSVILQNLFKVLFDRESLGTQHLELKLGEYSIKCGYVGEYSQGSTIFFNTSFKNRVYYTSAIQHNSEFGSIQSANYFSAKDIFLDRVSFSYMSGNANPSAKTTIMWIAIGK